VRTLGSRDHEDGVVDQDGGADRGSIGGVWDLAADLLDQGDKSEYRA
jgi:hypothetical protein